MRLRYCRPLVLLPLTAVCSLPLIAHAQIDRGGLSGTIVDGAGKLVPGVHVLVTEPANGLQRETTSSAAGAYDVPELPGGVYTLSFERAGFAPLTMEGVEQTIGHTRTMNVTLQVAGGRQQVIVSSRTTDVNETSDTLGGHAERKQVEELPLNGRNWSTLTALVPGAIDTGGSNQRSIRFAGRGLDDNNFTYDGIDATNIVNQAQQPFVRLAIPTDSIAEFRVDTMMFTAENGSTPGGQVAVASRSGSNTLHGDVFEFFRNAALDAREPIDAINTSKPPFHLNQFGGALGGPLQRDRTFFYLTYEGLRQSLGQTLPGFVPSEAFRAQVSAASPVLAPVLAAYPHASEIVSGSDGQIARFVGSGRQQDQEDSGMVRLDHTFSLRDTADVRFNFDAADSLAPLAGGGSYLNDRQEVSSRPVNAAAEYLHLFSPSFVNELKFGCNRGNVYTTNHGVLDLPYTVAVSGFSTLNNNQFKLGVGNSYSYVDNLTWVRGRHTLKSGVEVRRIQLNQGNTASGTVSYPTQAALLANQVSSATYAAELPVNGLRKTEVYAFVQDEWRLRPELTLNLGLRYSFYNRLHEVLGRAIPFDFASCGPQGFCGAGAEFSQANVLDLDPRVSVAWAPTSLGNRTVLRSGFGIYHGDGQIDDQNLPISNEVKRYSLTGIAGLSFPVTPFLANTPGIVSPRDMDRRRKDMYVSEWGLSVQQALPANFVGTLSYNGSKGTHLLTTSYLNLKDQVSGLREYPAFGQVEYRGNINNSYFQALSAVLQRAFSNGLLLSANYMLSHEIDQDAAGGGDSDFPQDPACLACERASGNFDARHTFSANTVYELPVGHGRRYLAGPGLAGAVLGGWQASSIISARSGLPVNVTIDRSSKSVATGYTTNQRPNRVPGVSLTPPGGQGVHNWINPAAFAPVTGGGYGDAGRNLARAIGLWQADLGLAKHIPVSESIQLEFRTELFNIFNRAQYGSPLADISSPGTFGLINNPVNVSPVGTGTPRQIQFLLRASF